MQTMGSWFLQEDAEGNSVKDLSKVQVDTARLTQVQEPAAVWRCIL